MKHTKILFGKDNGDAFRIPSMVNAGGTLVAVCDNGKSGCDWGYIELVCRTSSNGGESWSDVRRIAAPPARSTAADADNTKSAFFIDPCMAVCPNGDIVLLVTFFPESKGVHNLKYLEKKKIAFTSFDGEKCPIIYDRDGNYFIILEDGTVIDKSKAKSKYFVQDIGDLFQDEEYLGNIYLNGAQGKPEEGTKTTFGAPLKAPKRSYILMLRSKDRGQTWSAPRDITPHILNEEDEAFIGVAPGTGITTDSGRVIMPLYTMKGTVAIYSDDNGETWNRYHTVPYTGNKGEWTLAQAPDKRIYGFGRDKGKIPCTISFDNGIVWAKGDKPPMKAPFCQKHALVLGDKLLLSHPSDKERSHGVITVGKFTYDKKGRFKGVDWGYKTIELNHAYFAYSCMAPIDDTHVAVLYENKPSGCIVFDVAEIE